MSFNGLTSPLGDRNHFQEDYAGVLDGIHHIEPTRYIERELGGSVASRVYRLQRCTFNHVFAEKVHLSSGVLSILRRVNTLNKQMQPKL